MKKIFLLIFLVSQFLVSCKTYDSNIVVKQKAVCIYNDGKILMFEIKYECKTPNKTICTKTVQSKYMKGYEVGRTYMVSLLY